MMSSVSPFLGVSFMREHCDSAAFLTSGGESAEETESHTETMSTHLNSISSEMRLSLFHLWMTEEMAVRGETNQ